MNEICTQAQAFLNTIFDGAGFDLRVTVEEASDGCLLNLDGADSSLLLNEGGELLEALQHLANQVFGRALPKGERIICDVQNFRSTREAELRAMARHAADLWSNDFKRTSCHPSNACRRKRSADRINRRRHGTTTESEFENFCRELSVKLNC